MVHSGCHSFYWGKRTDGKADEYDFKVNDTTIDIKTSAHPKARFLMMPAVQLDRTQSDTLVGATIGQPKVEHVVGRLWGSIQTIQFRAIAKRTQRKIPTRELLLDELPADMNQLKRYLMVAW